jgi:hypothetical protein
MGWDDAARAAAAALVVLAAEQLDSDAPMRVARVTLDLCRPVPMVPLEIRSEILRHGRKIQLAAICLLARGVEVVRASVLRMRLSDPELPEGLREVALDLPGPERCPELSANLRIKSPFLEGVSARLATGRADRYRHLRQGPRPWPRFR